ncbi:MAG: DNA alkylation repair protein [Bacteroides sp.]|nr:DNA alkylation repair protein [Bacteroides sp.]
MKQQIATIEQALQACSDPVKREVLPGFFKTGRGEYGEGDRFMGVVVPDTRRVARQYRDVSTEVMLGLLQRPWHECRLCALLMLVERFRKSDEKGRKELFDLYLSHTLCINNWDLVDLSAPGIVGEYLKDKPRDVLYSLAQSRLLWEQRIAVVATLALIRNRDFIDILSLSEHFLGRLDEPKLYTFSTCSEAGCHTWDAPPSARMHDLMQKAIGWMLREMGKRDKDLLVQFLEKHAALMPRTMLRYAIEKFPEAERKSWMQWR